MARVGLAAGVLLVVVVYAALAARWTSAGSDWYRSLPRPRWQPPDLVFGVVWPLNFGALAVVGVVVALERPPGDGLRWLALFAASVVPALGWARAFYLRHALGRAAALLAGATVLTWGLVVLTHQLLPRGGWVLVPYAGWLTIATSLAVGYERLVGHVVPTPARGSPSAVHPRGGPARK